MSDPTFTINPTPSQEVVARANTEVKTTDTRGRIITLKKPGIYSQFDLVEMLGETATNNVFMNMVFPLTYVTAIDDFAVSRFTTRTEMKALIQQLDEEGIAAVMEAVQKNFSSKTAEEQAQAVKN